MKKRILLIEDNPIDAHSISHFTREAGYEVELASNAESGLELFRTQAFDLVFCDLHLPGKNGFDVCREIKNRKEGQSIPVVLLTRHSDPLNILRGLEAGSDGFISKDQNPARIIDRLQRTLAQQSLLTQDSKSQAEQLVFLDTEFKVDSARNQLMNALLFGLEDLVVLNDRYEAEVLEKSQALKALRESRFLHHAIVESLPIGVARKDLEGKYIFANAAACKLIGKPNDEIVGKTDFDVYSHQIAEQQRASDREVIESGQRKEELMDQRDERSEKVYIKLEREVAKDSDGIIVGTQIMLSDVTHLNNYKAELVQAKETAEQASHAKSQFLASMSHELRTPLNGVIGMTELLGSTELSEKQQLYVKTCRHSGESLLHLINDILDFSKIEAGKVEIDQHEIELEPLITGIVNTMSWHASKKNLEMPCFIDLALQNTLKGDSHRIRQILYNLLSNAIKFTESGQVSVRADAVKQNDDQMTVRISVSDTGIGIPADKLHRLFESFSQVDASTTRNYGGTGLGLRISQLLAELMGGTIDVKSDVGVGTTFRLELPFDVVSDSARPDFDPSRLVGMRGLIVDDNETNRVILAEYTAAWGLACVTSASVDEAVSEVERAEADGTPFHFVLTDYSMPRRDGLDLAQSLKSRQHLDVVLLSSTDVDLNASTLEESGVNATLRKPFRRQELCDVLLGLVGKARATNIAKEQSSSMHNGLAGSHVLLAEDNTINQMYMVELMKQLGCTCDTVANGRDAIVAVQQTKYDLVLMDCQMPEMDGFEATRQIRNWETEGTLNGHVPIVALTANAVKGDRERCIDAGMDDYLSKPVQKQEVASVLTRTRMRADADRRPLQTTAPAVAHAPQG